MKNYTDIINTYNKLLILADNIDNKDFNVTYKQIENILAPHRKKSNRILIVQNNGLGDMILSSGVLREIRKNYPTHHITLVCLMFWYPVVEFCPYVDEIIPNITTDINFEMGMKTTLNFCKDYLWNNLGYDIGINTHWGQTGILGTVTNWLGLANKRFGFDFNTEERFFPDSWIDNKHYSSLQNYNSILTKRFNNPSHILHDVEKRYWLLEQIGCKIEDKSLEIWIKEKFPLPDKFNIAICLGGSSNAKKYSVRKLFKALKEIYNDKICFNLLGSIAETDDANYLINKFEKNNINYNNFVNKLTIQESMSVIQQSKIYIGNDTGLLHCAVACNIPSISYICEPKNKFQDGIEVLSSHLRFRPYELINNQLIKDGTSKKHIVLQPNESLSECKDKMIHGYCLSEQSHCINQINYEDIINAYITIYNNNL